MATIVNKKSTVAGVVPLAANLVAGELAVNVADKRLYSKDVSNSVVEVGTNPSVLNLLNGTPNGVLFLNGSRVVSSGSALSFDGASLRLANAVGTSANGLRLDGGAQSHFWYLADNTSSVFEIGSGAGNWRWSNSNGEQMRLNSTGLGIGTSSPSRALTIERSGASFPSTSNPSIRLNETSSGRFAVMELDSSQNLNFWNGDAGAGSIRFYRGSGSGTLSMSLDGSGNLGLGVTPSAWGNAGNLELLGSRAISAKGSQRIFSNVYDNAGLKYSSNGFASYHIQENGAHLFGTAPSGTAGNAISFTQAMTLTQGGNLLVGTTSDLGPRVAIHAPSPVIRLQETASGGDKRLELSVVGAEAIIAANQSAQSLVFQTIGTERARITSGGYFKASNTGSYIRADGVNLVNENQHNIIGNGNGDTASVSNSNTGSAVNNLYSYLAAGSAGFHFSANLNATKVYQVLANGNVQNTNNSYGAISDIKLKENITDATPKLASLNQLRVVNYNLIGSDLKQIGLIAQEVEQVFPGLVEETPDTAEVEVTDEETGEVRTERQPTGTVTKAVKYSVLVPILLKALQEQTQTIEALTARVAALETK